MLDIINKVWDEQYRNKTTKYFLTSMRKDINGAWHYLFIQIV